MNSSVRLQARGGTNPGSDDSEHDGSSHEPVPNERREVATAKVGEQAPYRGESADG